MNARRAMVLHLLVLVLAAPLLGQQPGVGPTGTDDLLDAAKRFVDKSDRYLHHSHLKRGMKGYGLTVMAGTKPVRFEATIVSVVAQWGPGQHVILARLAGQNLEKTGVISGMSGSPVYMTDPADNKIKMIGAVAYGWMAQKEALCGIQPITQMLAIPGVLGDKAATTQPVALKGPASAVPRGVLRAVLNPKKIDFSTLVMPPARAPKAARTASRGQLAPLATPLMISSCSGRLFETLQKRLGPAGIIPLQAGSTMMGFKAPRPPRLAPGSAVSIPVVTGDTDWSAVGTVTEVIDDRVLAFGHSFFGEGQTLLPMGPAYVHTIISGVLNSFKLSSTLGRTGALEHDSHVGISGRIGHNVSMVPMTVALDWKVDGRKQTYNYQICRNRWLTPMLVSSLIREAAWGWRELPEFHTVRYSVDVDFGKLGKYHSANVSSGYDVLGAVSDASRPVVAMLNNPLGTVPKLRSVDVKISIEAGETLARILEFKLDGKAYRPGETVTGAMIIRGFRRKREKIPLSFKLPDNLPEGDYNLTACDAETAMSMKIQEMPQRFNPRTVEELFAAIKEVVTPDASAVYLRMPLKKGGLALGRKELPDLPPSRAKIITEANQLDTTSFSRTLVQSVQTRYVLNGSAEASFTVQARPRETRLKKSLKK